MRRRDYLYCVPGILLAIVFGLGQQWPAAATGYWIVFALIFCLWQFVVSALTLASARRSDESGGTKRYVLWLAVSGVGLAITLFRAVQAKMKL
jgi:hypothetical protein